MNKRVIKLGLIIIVVFIAIMTTITSLYITTPAQYTIVRQFGKIVSIVDEPGLRIKTPIIQSISKLPKYTLLYDVPPAEINTLDKKRIMVDYYAIWRITDPQKMIESLRTVQAAETRLGDIIYSNARTELGRLNFDQIINLNIGSRDDFDLVVKEKVSLPTGERGLKPAIYQ